MCQILLQEIGRILQGLMAIKTWMIAVKLSNTKVVWINKKSGIRVIIPRKKNWKSNCMDFDFSTKKLFSFYGPLVN